MAVVVCARCGQEREGAGKVGLPGTLGADIEARICAECWKEWTSTQIRVINHYGLRPAQREDREKLYELTRDFLQLTVPAGAVEGRGARGQGPPARSAPDSSEV
jgi:Fe-S cluster biosynthesis and repair protein YggX